MRGRDAPLVAIADPPLACADMPVVLTGYNQVTDPGRTSAGHRQGATCDAPLSDSISLGLCIELAYGAEISGNHQTCLAGFDVCFPCHIKGVKHLIPVAFAHPTMGLILVNGIW